MKNRFFLFLALIFSSQCFSQKGFQGTLQAPTKFDKFVIDKEIQWAAYSVDTLSFPEYNLAQILLDRFEKGRIKSSTPLTFQRGSEPVTYKDASEIRKLSYPPGDNSNSKPYRLDSSTVTVSRILYVEDGQIFAYVPWVSTRMYIATSTDFFIGMGEYFSTAINNDHEVTASAFRKAKFLSRTKSRFRLNFPKSDMLKEVYGHNMIEAVWAGMNDSKNEITDISGDKPEQGTGQNASTLAKLGVAVPVYDSTGNILGYRSTLANLSPSRYSDIEMVEEWFYDGKKNRLLCRIPEATLYIESLVDDGRTVIYPALHIRFHEK